MGGMVQSQGVEEPGAEFVAEAMTGDFLDNQTNDRVVGVGVAPVGAGPEDGRVQGGDQHQLLWTKHLSR